MEILRSPYAHARLKSIDTSAADALPGVVAVVTGELMVPPFVSGQAVRATRRATSAPAVTAAPVATVVTTLGHNRPR